MTKPVSDALCIYDHIGYLSVNQAGFVVCRYCNHFWSMEKIMAIHVKLDKITTRQMNDSYIWGKSDDDRIIYMQNEIGKLHCLIEEIEI